MKASRGMGDINPKKIPRAKRRGDSKPVIGTGKPIRTFNGTTGSSVRGDTAREPLKMDTRSSLERLGDLRTFNVGRNQTISVGGGLKSPSLTYKLKFKEGGLYENIHKKRARIAAGSGEKMRKVGSKGAPTAEAFRNSAKTAKGKKVKKFVEGGSSTGDEDYTRYNSRIMKALIKRYGSEATAQQVMRDTDGGELLRIMQEEEAKK